MNESNIPTPSSRVSPAKWYWWVAGVALIWNLLGVAAFFTQIATDPATLPDAQRIFYENMPAWATGGFAVAVFGGVLGCIALLMRRLWSLVMFVASVVGIVVQNCYSFLVGDGLTVFGPAAIVLPAITLAIGLALIGLARLAKKNGWLN